MQLKLTCVGRVCHWMTNVVVELCNLVSIFGGHNLGSVHFHPCGENKNKTAMLLVQSGNTQIAM